MKVLIIEDEPITARELKYVLGKLDKNIEIMDTVDSIESAVEFLSEEQPDLIFSDIHLADGICFGIFRQVEVTCPIVFCTAYDTYAIDTFTKKDIVFILKPFNMQGVRDALNSVKNLMQESALYNHDQEINIKVLSRLIKYRAEHKPRYLVA